MFLFHLPVPNLHCQSTAAPFFLQDIEMRWDIIEEAKLKKIRRVNKVRNPIWKHFCSWPDQKKCGSNVTPSQKKKQERINSFPLFPFMSITWYFFSSLPFSLKLIKKKIFFRKAFRPSILDILARLSLPSWGFQLRIPNFSLPLAGCSLWLLSLRCWRWTPTQSQRKKETYCNYIKNWDFWCERPLFRTNS